MIKPLKEKNLIITDFIISHVIPLFSFIYENKNEIEMTPELLKSTEKNVLALQSFNDEDAFERLNDFLLNIADPIIKKMITLEPFNKIYFDINELLENIKETLKLN